MGKVVSATLCFGAGTTEALETRWDTPPREGQVELLYDYGPALFPSGEMTGGCGASAVSCPWRTAPSATPSRWGAHRSSHPRSCGGQPDSQSFTSRTRPGGPSGSNKDRASALVIEHALRTGAANVSCASTGNVATSLALGAAAAGLQAVVFVPAEVNPAKLRLMLLAGAHVLKVVEGYKAAFRLSRAAAKALGWLDRNTGVNPMTLEAKKAVAFEIWEQMGRRPPDVVVAPVGNGRTLSALAKGFRELVRCGLASRVPRIIGVQARGCQPLKQAFDLRGALETVSPDTLADGIAVGAPVSAPSVLRDVRESGGGFVAVPDEQLLVAIQTLARDAGILAEDAGAAAFAGREMARSQGLLALGESVVALVTGSGLKTPEYLQPTREAHSIPERLEDVQAALGGPTP